MQVKSLGGKRYVFVCACGGGGVISQGILRLNSLEKNLTVLMFSKSYVNNSKEKKGVG